MHLIVRLTIGVLEVVGGILGVTVVVTKSWSVGSLELIPLLFGVVYACTIFAGIALLRDHRFGGFLSLIVQTLQLPYVAAAGCTYLFAAGAASWFMFGSNGIGMFSELGSQYGWSTHSTAESMPFGVNVIAAVAIALLLAVPAAKKKRRKGKKKRRPMAFA